MSSLNLSLRKASSSRTFGGLLLGSPQKRTGRKRFNEAEEKFVENLVKRVIQERKSQGDNDSFDETKRNSETFARDFQQHSDEECLHAVCEGQYITCVVVTIINKLLPLFSDLDRESEESPSQGINHKEREKETEMYRQDTLQSLSGLLAVLLECLQKSQADLSDPMVKKEIFLKSESVDLVLNSFLDNPVSSLYLLLQGEEADELRKKIQFYISQTIKIFSIHHMDVLLQHISSIFSKTVEEKESTTSLRKIQILSYIVPDAVSLSSIFKLVVSFKDKLKKEAICEIATHLYRLVMNWINKRVKEFVSLHVNMKNIEGTVDLIDLLLSWSKPHRKRFIMDSTCILLFFLCPLTLKETKEALPDKSITIKLRRELLTRSISIETTKIAYDRQLALRSSEIFLLICSILAEQLPLLNNTKDRGYAALPDYIKHIAEPIERQFNLILFTNHTELSDDNFMKEHLQVSIFDIMTGFLVSLMILNRTEALRIIEDKCLETSDSSSLVWQLVAIRSLNEIIERDPFFVTSCATQIKTISTKLRLILKNIASAKGEKVKASVVEKNVPYSFKLNLSPSKPSILSDKIKEFGKGIFSAGASMSSSGANESSRLNEAKKNLIVELLRGLQVEPHLFFGIPPETPSIISPSSKREANMKKDKDVSHFITKEKDTNHFITSMEFLDFLDCICSFLMDENEVSLLTLDCISNLMRPKWISIIYVEEQSAVGYWEASTTLFNKLADMLLKSKKQKLDHCLHAFKVVANSSELFVKSFDQYALKDDNLLFDKRLKNYLRAISKSETALLVTLCQPRTEIGFMVTYCLKLLCDLPISFEKEGRTTITANAQAYQELSALVLRKKDEHTSSTAQWKDIMSLLRRMETPTEGNLAAWATIKNKWGIEKEEILRDGTSGDKSLSEDSWRDHFSVWCNYTGFLTTLGGLGQCDKLLPIFDALIEELIKLLSCNIESISIETASYLGKELSDHAWSALFPAMLKVMKSESRNAIGHLTSGEKSEIFVTNCLFVIQNVLERCKHTLKSQVLRGITDIVLICHHFITNINTNNNDDAVESKNCLKKMMCEVIFLIMQQKKFVFFSSEITFRNELVPKLMEWMSDFSKENDSRYLVVSDNSKHENLRHGSSIEAVDIACMRAITALLRDLSLEKSVSSSRNFAVGVLANSGNSGSNAEFGKDDDPEDIKAHLFSSYFHFLSDKVLKSFKKVGSSEAGRSEDLKELTKEALGNLLNANIDAGFAYFIKAGGYHEDEDIRSAFLQVITNLLIIGGQFDNLGVNLIEEAKRDFISLLLHPSCQFALVLSDPDLCVPHSDKTSMQVCEWLLNAFLYLGDLSGEELFRFMREVIKREVQKTTSFQLLFRANNTRANVLMNAFSRKFGLKTITDIFGPLIIKVCKEDVSYEVNPDLSKDVVNNQKRLTQLMASFLEPLETLADQFAPYMHSLCSILKQEVENLFPEHGFVSVASFLILRFICPLITVPYKFGIIDRPPSSNAVKTLINVGKIMQNIASGGPFKEQQMLFLNPWMEKNSIIMTNFCNKMTVSNGAICPIAINDESHLAEESISYLHAYTTMKTKEIEKCISTADKEVLFVSLLDPLYEILSRMGPIKDEIINDLKKNNTKAEAGMKYSSDDENQKSAAELRKYIELSQNAGYKNTRGEYSKELQELMSQKKRMFYMQGKSKAGFPVYYLICRRLLNNINADLLLFIFIDLLLPVLTNSFSGFELVIDSTGVNAIEHDLPDQVIIMMRNLVPFNKMLLCKNVMILNPSSFFMIRFKQILPTHGFLFVSFSSIIKFITDKVELEEYIDISQIDLPPTTELMRSDAKTKYNNLNVLIGKKLSKITLGVGERFVHVWSKTYSSLNKKIYQLDFIPLDIVDGVEIIDDDGAEDPGTVLSSGKAFQIKYTWVSEQRIKFGVAPSHSDVSGSLINSIVDDLSKALTKRRVQIELELQSKDVPNRKFRPSDVPGTLLNMCLSNLGALSLSTRVAAYNLLTQLISRFKFTTNLTFKECDLICVPCNTAPFVMEVSESLAKSEKHLTLEFLKESLHAFLKEGLPIRMKHLCLVVMLPWLRNLAEIVQSEMNPEKKSFSSNRESSAVNIVKELLEILIDVTSGETDIYVAFVDSAWLQIAHDGILTAFAIEAFLARWKSLENYDFMKVNEKEFLMDPLFVISGSMLTRHNTIGKISSGTLSLSSHSYTNPHPPSHPPPSPTKIGHKSTVRNTKILTPSYKINVLLDCTITLSAHQALVVAEIVVSAFIEELRRATLCENCENDVCNPSSDPTDWMPLLGTLRPLLMLTFSNQVTVREHIPALFYSIVSLHATPLPIMKGAMHSMTINCLHSLLNCNDEYIENREVIQRILKQLHSPETIALFTIDQPTMDSVANLTALLLAVVEACKMSSTWKKSWLDYTLDVAFRSESDYRWRQFVAISVILESRSGLEIEESVTVKILDALRESLIQESYHDDSHRLLVICIVKCLGSVIHNIPQSILVPLFWPFSFLLKVADPDLFSASLKVMEKIISRITEENMPKIENEEKIPNIGGSKNSFTPFSQILKASRLSISSLDAACHNLEMIKSNGLNFNSNFSVSIVACMIKGFYSSSVQINFVTRSMLWKILDLAIATDDLDDLGYISALLPIHDAKHSYVSLEDSSNNKKNNKRPDSTGGERLSLSKLCGRYSFSHSGDSSSFSSGFPVLGFKAQKFKDDGLSFDRRVSMDALEVVEEHDDEDSYTYDTPESMPVSPGTSKLTLTVGESSFNLNNHTSPSGGGNLRKLSSHALFKNIKSRQIGGKGKIRRSVAIPEFFNLTITDIITEKEETSGILFLTTLLTWILGNLGDESEQLAIYFVLSKIIDSELFRRIMLKIDDIMFPVLNYALVQATERKYFLVSSAITVTVNHLLGTSSFNSSHSTKLSGIKYLQQIGFGGLLGAGTFSEDFQLFQSDNKDIKIYHKYLPIMFSAIVKEFKKGT